jgi:glyoxylate reductase
MPQKVLVTRPIPDIGIQLLTSRFEVTRFGPAHGDIQDALLGVIGEYDAMVALLSDPIDERLLSAGGNLKIVANHAVGYDNVDIAAARRHRVMVTNTPGVLTNATAEIAFALLICLARRIIEADRFTREGRFVGWDPLLLLGDELSGKTLGIVGMGRIGRDMAAKCRAFGMEILYYSRSRLDAGIEASLGASWCPLDELLERSNAVSLHTPATPETRHLIGRPELARMRRDAFLINTSRGEVVDEAALVAALESGEIKGTGLDVYEFEPRIPTALTAMENVVLLPHIGSATIETRNRMAETAARNVMAVLGGDPPLNPIPELADLC